MSAFAQLAEASSVWLDKVRHDKFEQRYHWAQSKDLQRIIETQPKIGDNKATSQKESNATGASKRSKQVEKVVSLPTKKACAGSSAGNLSSLADEIARARQHIKKSLQCQDGSLHEESVSNDEVSRLSQRIKDLESIANSSDKAVNALQSHINKLESRIAVLEKAVSSNKNKDNVIKVEQPSKVTKATSTSPAVVKKEEDDDIDLFGSDDEDNEDNEKLKQERLQAYEAKKSKKPALIAKSNVILDVKPWDDETDMKEMERKVREIQFDGLVWGASKLVPLAYGIHKLQISCVVEDEKVSVDLLQEQIEGLEELVQSMDIAAFNKV